MPPTSLSGPVWAHPMVAAAAAGLPPPWQVANDARRSHMSRVADLLERWALEMDFGEAQAKRWRAAGQLHDALRDASPSELRPILDRAAPTAGDGNSRHAPDHAESEGGRPPLHPRDPTELPAGAWHGPAAAIALRDEGVEDWELLHAVSWHTLGSRRFGLLGVALYAADFLEPGRSGLSEVRRSLRARMPREPGRVVREVVDAKIGYLSRAGRSVHPQTAGFLDFLADGWQGERQSVHHSPGRASRAGREG